MRDSEFTLQGSGIPSMTQALKVLSYMTGTVDELAYPLLLRSMVFPSGC